MKKAAVEVEVYVGKQGKGGVCPVLLSPSTKDKTCKEKNNSGRKRRGMMLKKSKTRKKKKTEKKKKGQLSLLADMQVHNTLRITALECQGDIVVVLHDDIIIVLVLVPQAQGL